MLAFVRRSTHCCLLPICAFIVLSVLFPQARAEDAVEIRSLADLKRERTKLAHRKRRIIFNNDGVDVVMLCKQATPDALLACRTTALVGTQVDTISYCSGWVFSSFLHRSELGQVFTCTDVGTDKEGVGFSKNKVKAFLDQGTDALQIMVDFCHKQGLEIFYSQRMNDTHDAWGAWYSPLEFPYLKKDHPEWLVSSGNVRVKYGGETAVDFSHREIRDLEVAYLREVCEKYDVDGIELDFFRHPLYFKSHAIGREVTQQERDLMTDMLRNIRKMTEEIGLKRGRPILVSVRTPDSVGYCNVIGLDVVRWLEEDLFDFWVVTGYVRLNPWKVSIDLGHKYGVPVYACLSDSRMKGDKVRSRNRPECNRARAANAWAAGADGVCMFNFFNPRDLLWNELGDPATLESLDKMYTTGYRGTSHINNWVPNGERFLTRNPVSPERPRSLTPGKPECIKLTVAQRLAKESVQQQYPTVSLQLWLKGPTNPLVYTVKLNGKRLTGGNRIASGEWIEYPVDPALVDKGVNQIEITLDEGVVAKATLRDLVLLVRYGPES